MSHRILVVEDQEDNRQILRDPLTSADFEVIEAAHSGTGLAAAHRPDLILMDIQLLGRRLRGDASPQGRRRICRPSRSSSSPRRHLLCIGRRMLTRHAPPAAMPTFPSPTALVSCVWTAFLGAQGLLIWRSSNPPSSSWSLTSTPPKALGLAVPVSLLARADAVIK
jgi:hypothetical protein